MRVVTEIIEARDWVDALRREGRSVGLVPTMGALHRGHLSLVEESRRRCNATAVTIFVNPTQFSPGEDFASYPRPIEHDLEACRAAGVDLVFTPSKETMYPAAPLTTVHVSRMSEGLCGRFRPGHFDGVATVVSKLFHILPANAAFFGEKDYQQLVIIRQMVRDLNWPIEIVGCLIVREPDGLALSSRNVYLNERERIQATSLSRGLFAAVERTRDGERNPQTLIEIVRSAIQSAGPAVIEYIELVDACTLEPLAQLDRPARLCLAVRIGTCRLIDNVPVDGTRAAR